MKPKRRPATSGECKTCGRSIIWATNEQGKRVALTITMEVYSIVYPGPHDSYETKRAKKQVYVNHKITCGAVFKEQYGLEV